ncbi:hypothetical protein [Halococcus agarilyticus]|uniref:hypothetical protein n=1 Tax=Halococcus agarilyticus TaxID=1232219 RepID=UPI000677CA7D|nr:hypothetical protein [Halococcus agarilyticus]
MSASDDDLPGDWTGVDDTDEKAGQYDPQRPLHYEHTDGIELVVQPTSPNVADADEADWRVRAISEGGDETESLRDGVEGRDDAIGVAREFMTAYEERCVEGDESPTDLAASF